MSDEKPAEARGDVEAAIGALVDACYAAGGRERPASINAPLHEFGGRSVRHFMDAIARLVNPLGDVEAARRRAHGLCMYCQGEGWPAWEDGKASDRCHNLFHAAIDAIARLVAPAAASEPQPKRCPDCRSVDPAVRPRMSYWPSDQNAELAESGPCRNSFHDAPAAPASETPAAGREELGFSGYLTVIPASETKEGR